MFMKPWWIHIAQKTACNRLGTACTCTACTIWITLQNYSLLRVGWSRQFDQDKDFPGGSDGEVSVYNAGDLGSMPGLGRFPGEGNGNPLQYSCLQNPMEGGAWQATVHGVAKSQTQLRDFTSFHFTSWTHKINLILDKRKKDLQNVILDLQKIAQKYSR